MRFWEQLRAALSLFPPPAADRPLVESFAPLGLLGGPDTYLAPDPDLANLLAEASSAGQARVDALATGGMAQPVNGWLQGMHSFDYNTDRLELGTINSPEWKIADRNRAYEVRAGSAKGGLWGIHGYEADYAYTFVDDRGEPLTGERRYVMHFDRTPPVDAFWSLTMYDLEHYYLVANPIDRYSIGDRTAGVRYNEDGSLDLYLQHDPPGPDHQANWLPTPAGAFRPLLRMYQPQAAIFDGSYVLPPITRVD